MARFELFLLGPPRPQRDGAPLQFDTCKIHDPLCWLLASSTGFSCAEITEIRYHAVQSTIHLESTTA
jgi:hypothetical protein